MEAYKLELEIERTYFRTNELSNGMNSRFSISSYHTITAPSFVPRHGMTSMPKNIRALSNVYGNTNVASASSRRNDIKMMPIGVPKVAYRVPGSQSADW